MEAVKPTRGLVVVAVLLLAGGALPTDARLAGALILSAGSSESRLALEQGTDLFRLGLLLNGLLLLLLAVADRRLAATPIRPAAGRGESLSGGQKLTVGGLLVLAAALRFYRSGTELWFDEVVTLTQFVRPSWPEILGQFGSDHNHLLYSLLAKASVTLLGESETALRLPAILFGLAGLGALFLLARRVSGNKEAILALALLTVLYHHIWFSQNARAYTGLLAATLVSTWLLLEALSRDRLTTWIAYALSTAVGMWLHLTFAFVTTAQALGVLGLALLRRSGMRSFPWRSLGGFFLAATVSFQVYALLLPQVLAFLFREPAPVDLADFEWREPWWLLVETLRRLGAGLFFGEMLVAAVIALSVVGLVSLARRDPFVALLFVLPSLLCLGTLLMFGRSLWPRFFFGALGFGVVVMVRGTVVVGEAAMSAIRRPSPRRVGGVGLASALVAASAAALPALYRYPKQDFTGARDWVVSRRQPNDTVVALDLAAGAYIGFYAPNWEMAGSVSELEALRPARGATWVVYTFPAHLADKAPHLVRYLEAEFELERVFPGTLGDGAIVVRRAAPPAP